MVLIWEEEFGLLPLLPNNAVEQAVPSNEYFDIERGQGNLCVKLDVESSWTSRLHQQCSEIHHLDC